MPTTLDTILARTLLTVAQRKQTANLPQMEARAESHTPRGFETALRTAARTGPAVIAELKRASPSRGTIREDFRPAALARSLAGVGAAALSVLTDELFFGGSLEDLTAASQAVTIPVLRKDFVLDPFQILEARAAGADAILLIVAAHTDATLRTLTDAARALKLDVLCEVHDEEELKRAVALGVGIIGVNSRNLRTMQVQPGVQQQLVRSMPANVIRVAESGIRGPEDVDALLSVGYDAFLIGEALMRQPEPAATLALMLGVDYRSEF